VLAELGGDRTGRVLSGVVSNSSVRLVNRVNTTVTPIWNVYAALPGRVRDEVVVVGCHRDAWVMVSGRSGRACVRAC
jgi:N-acetylated-alpha-linked acidic dipeptidase